MSPDFVHKINPVGIDALTNGGILIGARFVRLRGFRQRQLERRLLLERLVVTIKKITSTINTSINATDGITAGVVRRLRT